MRKAAHSSSLCPVGNGDVAQPHFFTAALRRGPDAFLDEIWDGSATDSQLPIRKHPGWKGKGWAGGAGSRQPQKWSRPGCRMSTKQNACHLYHRTSLWLPGPFAWGYFHFLESGRASSEDSLRSIFISLDSIYLLIRSDLGEYYVRKVLWNVVP